MSKKAFTLFELIIVVIIIGVVYALVLGNFNPKNSVKIPTLHTIKESLLPYWQKGSLVELIVYDNCNESAVFVNSYYDEPKETDLNLAMFKDIEVFRIDQYDNAQKINFAPAIIDEKIQNSCFRFTLFPNGSSSSYIVKSGKEYIVFFPFFESPEIYTDLGDALEHYQHKSYTRITAHE